MNLMDRLAAAMNRTATITVTTVYKSIGVKAPDMGGTLTVGAAGGIVNRPTFALIGEAGPEAVIPLDRSRGNESLPSASSFGSRSAGTINLTINAGMGTDGAEVGRQVVDALKAYSRRNGPLPLAVA